MKTCMESHSCQLEELSAKAGDIPLQLEEQHSLPPVASRMEEDGDDGDHGDHGGYGGHGGHGGHGVLDMDSGAIVDDVLAALPLLGRRQILPVIQEVFAQQTHASISDHCV